MKSLGHKVPFAGSVNDVAGRLLAARASTDDISSDSVSSSDTCSAPDDCIDAGAGRRLLSDSLGQPEIYTDRPGSNMFSSIFFFALAPESAFSLHVDNSNTTSMRSAASLVEQSSCLEDASIAKLYSSRLELSHARDFNVAANPLP